MNDRIKELKSETKEVLKANRAYLKHKSFMLKKKVTSLRKTDLIIKDIIKENVEAKKSLEYQKGYNEAFYSRLVDLIIYIENIRDSHGHLVKVELSNDTREVDLNYVIDYLKIHLFSPETFFAMQEAKKHEHE